MNGDTLLFNVWLFALAVVLYVYIKTGSGTKWNNCAAILMP